MTTRISMAAPGRRTLLALAMLLPLAAAAQTPSGPWPNKPIRMVVPYPAGGNSDAIARFVADKLGQALGQAVVVENKGGAGATIGTEAAARSPGDGYTLLLAPNAVFTITPHLRKVPYDPVNDFVPIARVSGSYSIVTARKDAPFNTMPEMAAEARKAPEKYTFGSAGLATATHLSGELVAHGANVKLMHIPYKGSAEALNDLVGQRIDLLFDPVSLAQIKAGNVKAIGVLSDNRHPELPNVPTAKEQGMDIDSRAWFSLFAPKGTPQPIVDRIASETEKFLAQPQTREVLLKFSQYPNYEGPKAFAQRIQQDSAAFGKLIRDAKISVD